MQKGNGLSWADGATCAKGTPGKLMFGLARVRSEMQNSET